MLLVELLFDEGCYVFFYCELLQRLLAEETVILVIKMRHISLQLNNSQLLQGCSLS